MWKITHARRRTMQYKLYIQDISRSISLSENLWDLFPSTYAKAYRQDRVSNMKSIINVDFGEEPKIQRHGTVPEVIRRAWKAFAVPIQWMMSIWRKNVPKLLRTPPWTYQCRFYVWYCWRHREIACASRNFIISSERLTADSRPEMILSRMMFAGIYFDTQKKTAVKRYDVLMCINNASCR